MSISSLNKSFSKPVKLWRGKLVAKSVDLSDPGLLAKQREIVVLARRAAGDSGSKKAIRARAIDAAKQEIKSLPRILGRTIRTLFEMNEWKEFEAQEPA